METIIGCMITGGLSLIGVIITNSNSNRKIQMNMEKQQAITDYKLEELTREVRKHNGFAERIPVLEERVDDIRKKIGG